MARSYCAHNGGFFGKSFFQGGPVLRTLDLEARECVVALGVAPLYRYWQLVAGLHRLSAEYGQRQNSFAFESDVDEHGVGSNDYYRAFQLPSAIF